MSLYRGGPDRPGPGGRPRLGGATLEGTRRRCPVGAGRGALDGSGTALEGRRRGIGDRAVVRACRVRAGGARVRGARLVVARARYRSRRGAGAGRGPRGAPGALGRGARRRRPPGRGHRAPVRGAGECARRDPATSRRHARLGDPERPPTTSRRPGARHLAHPRRTPAARHPRGGHAAEGQRAPRDPAPEPRRLGTPDAPRPDLPAPGDRPRSPRGGDRRGAGGRDRGAGHPRRGAPGAGRREPGRGAGARDGASPGELRGQDRRRRRLRSRAHLGPRHRPRDLRARRSWARAPAS